VETFEVGALAYPPREPPSGRPSRAPWSFLRVLAISLRARAARIWELDYAAASEGIRSRASRRGAVTALRRPVGAPGFEPGTSSPPGLYSNEDTRRQTTANALTMRVCRASTRAPPHRYVSRFRSVWATRGVSGNGFS
jgi:hypothetical protein